MTNTTLGEAAPTTTPLLRRRPSATLSTSSVQVGYALRLRSGQAQDKLSTSRLRSGQAQDKLRTSSGQAQDK